MAKEPKKHGRPSKFSQEVADAICERLANGETLTSICEDENLPAVSTVIKWTQDKEKTEFYEQYARAREIGYLRMADEILDCADDGRNDWITRKTRGGGEIEVFNKEAAERSKLRVDTRKWLLSKALPKIYGDKLDVNAKHEAGDSFKALWAALGKEGAGK